METRGRFAPPRSASILRPAALALALALALTACSSGSGEADTALTSVEPSGIQDLVVAVGPDPYAADFAGAAHLGLRDDTVNPQIFETLTRVTPTYGLTAGLARSWEMVDPTLWRFELRDGVTFHDGAALDAGAVADSLASLARDHVPPRGIGPESAVAVDPLTVEIRLSVPNARLAEDLSNPATGIVAPGTRSRRGLEATPTGTGPFAFDGYEADASLRVRANPDYWDTPPTLASVTFVFGAAEDASRLLATRAVDMAGALPAHVLGAVSGRSDRLMTSAPARTVALLMNRAGAGPWSTLADAGVRQAVSLTLDSDEIVDAAWPAEVEPNPWVIAGIVLDEVGDDAGVRGPDRQQAKALLAAAGWGVDAEGQRVRDGQRLTLGLVLARPAELRPLVEPIRAQLATVGIGLEVIDPAPMAPGDRLAQSTFDLYLEAQTQPDANPCAVCRRYVVSPGGDLLYSAVVGGGPAADELFEQVNSVVSIDGARRLAAELMGIVVGDEATTVGLGNLPTTWLVAPWVKVFSPAANPAHQSWSEVVLVDKPVATRTAPVGSR